MSFQTNLQATSISFVIKFAVLTPGWRRTPRKSFFWLSKSLAYVTCKKKMACKKAVGLQNYQRTDHCNVEEIRFLCKEKAAIYRQVLLLFFLVREQVIFSKWVWKLPKLRLPLIIKRILIMRIRENHSWSCLTGKTRIEGLTLKGYREKKR